MDHISNLCKVLFTTLLLSFCYPVYAQDRTYGPGEISPKLINAMCGDLQTLIDYLNSSNHDMVFMGETITQGIYDSLWFRYSDKTFVYVRATQNRGEGCMVSNGITVWTEIIEKQSL
jgi:hypothetical protein